MFFSLKLRKGYFFIVFQSVPIIWLKRHVWNRHKFLIKLTIINKITIQPISSFIWTENAKQNLTSLSRFQGFKPINSWHSSVQTYVIYVLKTTLSKSLIFKVRSLLLLVTILSFSPFFLLPLFHVFPLFPSFFVTDGHFEGRTQCTYIYI